ncbi:MAG: TIGR02147 family protein [Fibrobacter sp.]|nr:TIGR02147 family protein [Fibrobacter sp.]
MNIYEYDDFRLYLKDCYDEKKSADPSYSYRRFASDAGFTNPGYLNDVIKGRRKLSVSASEKMIAVFAFTPKEAEFFRLLVQYRQEKNETERQEVYKQIIFRRNRSSFARINPALSKYYQDYHYPLIRAALMAMEFRGDYEALGNFLVPSVPAAQVKKYIRDLCDWGMVEQQTDGLYRVTDQFVEPPSTLRDLVKQINREWILQAVEPLMKLPANRRHISTMLLSVSSETQKKINEKIEQFRDEIWDLVRSDTAKADRVMQLNLQYFPKSREGTDHGLQ